MMKKIACWFNIENLLILVVGCIEHGKTVFPLLVTNEIKMAFPRALKFTQPAVGDSIGRPPLYLIHLLEVSRNLDKRPLTSFQFNNFFFKFNEQ
jgi:hypothetical protein